MILSGAVKCRKGISMNIRVDNVTKTIKGKKVLDQVSMELNSPAVVGLSGINGSGKTMLMRLISGLIYPTEGDVWIDGKRMGKEIEFPDSVGALIENPAFIDTYSAKGNLKLLASINRTIGDTEIERAIEKVGLDYTDKLKYRKYSLGMKQRLGIAAAIMESPELLILDEPTNALDRTGVEMVRNIIMEEKARGALVVLSCHDRDFLYSVVDDLYELEEGRITGRQLHG
jgi:ABC-2 type transport system ATP-binding protein